MTIQQAQETVDTWIRTIGVRYFSELTNTAILMEEVGEVARLMARLYGEQSFKNTEKYKRFFPPLTTTSSSFFTFKYF